MNAFLHYIYDVTFFLFLKGMKMMKSSGNKSEILMLEKREVNALIKLARAQ